MKKMKLLTFQNCDLSPAPLGSVQEQREAIAQVKCFLKARKTDDREADFSCLGRLQKKLRITRWQSMRQTCDSQFHRTREIYEYRNVLWSEILQ